MFKTRAPCECGNRQFRLVLGERSYPETWTKFTEPIGWECRLCGRLVDDQGEEVLESPWAHEVRMAKFQQASM